MKGGLGNQMFQFSAAYSLAQNLSVALDIDTSYYPLSNHNNFELKNVFGLNDNKLVFNKKYSRFLNRLLFFVESKLNVKIISTLILSAEDLDNAILYENNKIILDDYFQSEKYFVKHRKNLLKLLCFPVLSGRNLETQGFIEKNNTCSIHIRRGDYITNPGAVMNMARINSNYYKKAKTYIEKNVKNVKFVYFSDDINWVRNEFHIANSDIVVDWNNESDSYVDMQLMSLCQHNIIANSSFSWWGAWLNKNTEKVVVAPKKWFNNVSLNSQIIPSNWIKF
jgi:hypothetical protein